MCVAIVTEHLFSNVVLNESEGPENGDHSSSS